MLTLPRPLDVPFTDTSAEALRLSLDHGRIAPLASRNVHVPTVVAPTDTVIADTESTLAEATPALALTLTVIGSSHQAILSAGRTDAFIETFACLGEDGDDSSPKRTAVGLAKTSATIGGPDSPNTDSPRLAPT
jgi:hypothetical protein